jgi:hypothetical protein
VRRGLEDVLAAARGERSAHEHDRRELVRGDELADRVEHDDVAALRAVRAQPRAEPERLGERADLARALAVARRDQQPERRVVLPQPLEDGQQQRLLALVRRAGDDERPAVLVADRGGDGVGPALLYGDEQRVELRVAGDEDPARLRAERRTRSASSSSRIRKIERVERVADRRG